MAALTIAALMKPGAPSKEEPLAVFGATELTMADLRLFADAPPPAHEIPPLKRLRERHHALARLSATGGLTDGQICAIVGFDQSRFSILKNDPSFAELIEFYRDEVRAEYKNLHSQLAGVAGEAAEELQRRLEEEPEKISTSTLLDVVVKMADRTGHGPTSSTKAEVNINIGLADRMRAAREQARAASLIDVTPNKESSDE